MFVLLRISFLIEFLMGPVPLQDSSSVWSHLRELNWCRERDYRRCWALSLAWRRWQRSLDFSCQKNCLKTKFVGLVWKIKRRPSRLKPKVLTEKMMIRCY